MDKDIIPETEQGSKADVQLQRARHSIYVLDRQIKRLSLQGVLHASYGFKKDQPNEPMYCYVRQFDGSRKYVHIGVNKAKKRETIQQIERYKKQQKLMKLKIKIESRITDVLQQQSMILEICNVLLIQTHL